MTASALQFGLLVADASQAGTLRSLELDWPESAVGWTLLVLGPLALFAWIVFLNVLDTRTLLRRSLWWLPITGWLIVLRLAALGAVLWIALNPQERTQTVSYRRSRVAILIDTSLSMRYPEMSASLGTSTPGGTPVRARSDAVAAFLADSPFIERLRTVHDVSIYTFDSTLSSQPRLVLYEKTAGRPEPASGSEAAGTSTSTGKQGEGTDSPVAGNDNNAANVAAGSKIDWGTMLRPEGLETRLGESLLKALSEINGPTLAGIVVITDGGSNAGVEPATAQEVARTSKPPVRLVTVGVGSTDQPINLQIASIQAPTDVHLGDAFDFSIYVQGQGLAGRAVEVELLTRPEGSDEKPIPVEPSPEFPNPREVTLREDGVPVEVKYRRLPSVAGAFEFFARAKVKADVHELSSEDNERRRTINVTDRETRVLLLAGGPTREYRFVRNMLYRHKGVAMDVLLQTVDQQTAPQVSQESKQMLLEFPPTAADLFEYDVIVAFDPDWKRLTAEQVKFLNEWVSVHAGGMILVAGDVFTPELAAAGDELEPIREMYPVFLSPAVFDPRSDQSAAQAWPIQWTDEGKNSGFLQLTDDPATAAGVWQAFAGVHRTCPTNGARAGATLYARFSDPRAQSEFGQPILLASQFYGAGRTLFVGSSELWRLRAIGEEYYERLWTKTIREAGQGRLQRGNSRGMLLLERSQYVLGQTVRVRASLLTPQLAPLDVESVTIEVIDPTGRPLIPQRVLQRDKNRPGQFAGDFRASLPGTYQIQVPVPESPKPLVGKVDVTLPNLEADNARQNARLLNDLAKETNGRYLQLGDLTTLCDETLKTRQKLEETRRQGDQAAIALAGQELAAAESKLDERLADLLPNHGEEFFIDEKPITLWDREWMLWLLAGFLSVEWLTRKLLKLA